MISGGRLDEKKKKEELERRKMLLARMSEDKKKELKVVYEDFQKSVVDFAKNNPKEIRKNTEFRQKFNQLCLDLGVDPMVSKKTIWSELGFGDFYNELAIKVYRICISTRNVNGGMMKVSEVINIYNKKNEEKVTKDDIKRALQTLNSLGTGCFIKGEYIVSVPLEINNDATDLINLGDQHGYVSAPLLQQKMNWNQERFDRAITPMISEGLVWVDAQTGGAPHFFFASMWTK